MNQLTLVNLTDQPVTFYNDAGAVILVIPPYSVPPPCLLTYERISNPVGTLLVNGVEIPVGAYGTSVHLPEPAPGVGYIVPNHVLEAVGGFDRNDVFSPDWLTAINDAEGRPVGVRGLMMFGG